MSHTSSGRIKNLPAKDADIKVFYNYANKILFGKGNANQAKSKIKEKNSFI